MLLRVATLMCALLLALASALPAEAQVKLQDLGYQAKPLEPGDGSPIENSEVIEGVDVDIEQFSGQVDLGEGIIVFKFKVTDIDPIADDFSDVAITCFRIQNLGTATFVDIAEVAILDQDGNSVATAEAPVAVVPGAVQAPSCSSIEATGTTSSNPQIQWEVFFRLDGFDDITPGIGGGPEFVIPDDGSEEFQVVVRVRHRLDDPHPDDPTDSTDLLDDSQNHTLVLRATLQVNETVGSPPDATTFVDPVTDSAPEVIWNGGINRWTEDSWVVNPIMPGATDVVSRFTVCDWDSNEHQLIIDRFFVKQDEGGTATHSDIVSLDLYRVEGFTRTLIASRTPDPDFNRSSGAMFGADDTPGMAIPAGGFTAITVPDDTCMTFELEAQVSQFAFKGHTIMPRFQISTQEPDSNDISQTVDPEVKTSKATMIGKGLIVLPDTRLIGKPGIIPLNVAGVQLPGVGTLQVGPWGRLQYDPRVINIKSIRGVGPYVVDAVEIDNRQGEVRFTVRIDPSYDVDDDGDPDNPLLTAYQDGTIAQIFVEPIGDPGDVTRLVLTFDCFELVDQMNCMPVGFPYPDTPNQNPNNDISISAGEVTLLYPGDIDMDGQPTVRDALKLASALLACTGTNPTLPSPDDDPPPSTGVFDPANTTLNYIMTDEQKSIADVAPPFADTDEIPDCAELTSADVAEIARLAINFGTSPAPKAISSAVAASGGKPWYNVFGDLWNWLTGSRATLAQVGLDFDLTAQTLRVNISDIQGMGLGGIQGRISYDPAALQVQNVLGANGYRVLAYHVDNLLGEVRFLAVASDGQAFHQGAVVELQVIASDRPFAPGLTVEALVDARALDIPFAMAQASAFAAAPTPLSLSGVQALSQGHGSFRFQASGSGIAGIRVQVYDLAGGLVFDQETSGNALTFNGLSPSGKPLANGVYLYVVTAKGFQGQSARSQVEKFPILR